MITVEPATYEHAAQLYSGLSFLDMRETEMYIGCFGIEMNAYETLMKSVENAREARALIDDGKVLCIWGVQERTEASPYGMPWLMSRESHEFSFAAQKRLIKEARKSIAKWHTWYNRLEGFSWANAKDHHKFLRALGFELSNPITKTASGMEIPPTVMFCRDMDYINEGAPYYVRG